MAPTLEEHLALHHLIASLPLNFQVASPSLQVASLLPFQQVASTPGPKMASPQGPQVASHPGLPRASPTPGLQVAYYLSPEVAPPDLQVAPPAPDGVSVPPGSCGKQRSRRRISEFTASDQQKLPGNMLSHGNMATSLACPRLPEHRVINTQFILSTLDFAFATRLMEPASVPFIIGVSTMMSGMVGALLGMVLSTSLKAEFPWTDPVFRGVCILLSAIFSMHVVFNGDKFFLNSAHSKNFLPLEGLGPSDSFSSELLYICAPAYVIM